MADLTTLPTSVQYDPSQVQGMGNLVFSLIVGMAIGAIALFVLYKLWQRLTYPYIVDVHEKVGTGELESRTLAKKIMDGDGNTMIDFMGVGRAQVWKEFADYLRNVKTTMFFILPTVKKGFSIYKIGEKIVPIKIQSNPGIVPVDYDMFNYMQYRIRANIAKYQKQDRLMQLLPILGLGMVVLAFIFGSLFWGKHVENIATKILTVSADKASELIQMAKNTQVIPPN
jgi:hypothetical protein